MIGGDLWSGGSSPVLGPSLPFPSADDRVQASTAVVRDPHLEPPSLAASQSTTLGTALPPEFAYPTHFTLKMPLYGTRLPKTTYFKIFSCKRILSRPSFCVFTFPTTAVFFTMHWFNFPPRSRDFLSSVHFTR